jgi:drug/metabolite transporter (DMT)-like permease
MQAAAPPAAGPSSPGPPRASGSPLAGLGLMFASILCFVLMGGCFRLALAEGVPLPLLPFARGGFTLLLLLPWLVRAGPQAMATRRPLGHLGRGAAGIASFGLYVLAIAWMPLADAIAIMQARPLWVLPLAVLILRERLRRDRVLAALIGFAGVLVIARPDGELSAGTLAAIGSGITGALVLIAMRHLSATEPPARVVAWYAVASVLAWGPVSALVWTTPSTGAVLLLLAGSAAAVAGDWLAQMATRRAEVGLLAPVEYVAIPASAGLGLLLFGERPGWELLLGTLLMAGATLYLLRSGRRPRRG